MSFSFIQWVTLAVLAAIAVAGCVAGVQTILRRRVDVPPYIVVGRGAVLLALVYFGGAVAAAIGAVLMFIS